MTALLVAQGVPMLTMGDEYGHTRLGAATAPDVAGDLNYFRWDAVDGSLEVRPVSDRCRWASRHLRSWILLAAVSPICRNPKRRRESMFFVFQHFHLESFGSRNFKDPT